MSQSICAAFRKDGGCVRGASALYNSSGYRCLGGKRPVGIKPGQRKKELK